MKRLTDEMLKPSISLSRQRSITRRAVLWLGLKCDLHCKFCYDAKIRKNDKDWIAFNDAVIAIKKFKFFYNSLFVDFMGGEPTLYPDIIKLIAFSSEIGLRPSCITHAIHLGNKATIESYKAAGIHDFLISLHATGNAARKIHQVSFDSFSWQLRAIENMSELGIPFRVNVTVIRDNLQYLVDIARLTAAMGGRVLNLIAFNPYFEWTSLGNIRFQLRHSEAAPFLKKAIDICNANSIEVNVRYFPICILHGYERHVFTNFQLPYDCHEWNFNSWFDKGIAGSPSREWYYNESNMLRLRHGYVQTEKCAQCSAKTICDGLHMQYVKRWGDDELQPMQASPLEKPTFFIKDQLKVEYMTDCQKTQSDMRMEYNLSLSQFSKEKGNRAGLRG